MLFSRSVVSNSLRPHPMDCSMLGFPIFHHLLEMVRDGVCVYKYASPGDGVRWCVCVCVCVCVYPYIYTYVYIWASLVAQPSW